MKVNIIGVIAVLAVVAAACSGGTSGVDDPGAADSGPSVTSDTISASDSAGGGENQEALVVTTVVTIGSETYEVDGSTACLTGGVLSFTIANETEQISIMHANDVVQIRMAIDGEDWVDTGSPPAPVVTGNGTDAVITWSGEMSSNGVSSSVSIEAYC